MMPAPASRRAASSERGGRAESDDAHSLAAAAVAPQTGAVLLHLLMQSCTVNVPGQTPGEMVIEPAFYTHYATGPEGRRYGTVAWHESVLQMIGDSNIVRMAMQPRYLPMLVPSRPWVRVRLSRAAPVRALLIGGCSSAGDACCAPACWRAVRPRRLPAA